MLLELEIDGTGTIHQSTKPVPLLQVGEERTPFDHRLGPYCMLSSIRLRVKAVYSSILLVSSDGREEARIEDATFYYGSNGQSDTSNKDEMVAEDKYRGRLCENLGKVWAEEILTKKLPKAEESDEDAEYEEE